MSERRKSSSEVSDLKKRIKQLEKDNTKLKSECRTLEIALAKNIMVMKERAEHSKLEDLMSQANKKKK